MLSFVYRYLSKDITKNFSPAEAVSMVRDLLTKDFYNADLFTLSHTYYYSVDISGKEKLVIKEAGMAAPLLKHDKEKKRLIDPHALYLKALGITGAEGHVKKEMQHKYRQVNRYVEIIDGIIKDQDLNGVYNVTDMGSGKGYLTFALYDHLRKKNKEIKVTGVEIRKELVNSSNAIAKRSGYEGLHFMKGSIADTVIEYPDMLIALHACDTATDDAIAKGIRAKAKIIICAPCCHKQIRKQMAPENALKNITKHGILLERQAEMVTDTIRALMLEAYGYSTKVFDFIEQEDTPKNVLIVGVKSNAGKEFQKENLKKISELKALFNIGEHYLETVL